MTQVSVTSGRVAKAKNGRYSRLWDKSPQCACRLADRITGETKVPERMDLGRKISESEIPRGLVLA